MDKKLVTDCIGSMSFRTCSPGVGRGGGLFYQSIPSAAGSTQISQVDQRYVVIVYKIKVGC